MFPVSFMNEEATNDLSAVGHVFWHNTFGKYIIYPFLPSFHKYLLNTYYGTRSLHLLKLKNGKLPPHRADRHAHKVINLGNSPQSEVRLEAQRSLEMMLPNF